MSDQLTGLLTESRQLGFLGPGPVEAHIPHAMAFVATVSPAPARALDLGAGGGLPGLVLATLAWPDTRWTFLDAQHRRTEFLTDAIDDLGLGHRVTVVNGRAEEVGRLAEHRQGYDLVVARSFGPPAVTAECAAPLLQVGGHLVVSEPPEAELDGRWPTDGVALAGFGPAERLTSDGDDPVHLARLRLEHLADDRLPRRVGVPNKRPLF